MARENRFLGKKLRVKNNLFLGIVVIKSKEEKKHEKKNNWYICVYAFDSCCYSYSRIYKK
jgi:hypothetical protein